MNKLSKPSATILFFLCILAYLIPSLVYSQDDKKHDIEYAMSNVELGLLNSKCYILSPNFIIYFQKNKVSRNRAAEIAGLLEYSWNKITNNLGYAVPADFQKYRVPVYLKDVVPGTAGGQAVSRKLGLLTCIEMDWQASDVKMKVLTSHEVFHIFEEGYAQRTPDNHWLSEASAVWVEDEVYLEKNPAIGYIRDSEVWYQGWSRYNLSLFEMGRDQPIRPFAYGSSIFLKYLSEHHPDGKDAIKKIWQNFPLFSDDYHSLTVIEFALGRIDKRIFKEYFTKFCAALYLKDKPPYDFKRADEIKGSLTIEHLKGSHNEWYLLRPPYTGKMPLYSPITGLNPLSAAYYEIKAPAGLLQPANLYITLSQFGERPLTFALIKQTATALNNLNAEVEIMTDIPQDTIVKKIPDFGGKLKSVILAVCNTSKNTGFPVRIGYAVSEPPYLREVRIYKNGYKDLIYHARWNDSGDGKRQLEVLKDEVSIEEKNSVNSINIELQFSEAIQEGCLIKFGNAQTQLNSINNLKESCKGNLAYYKIDKNEDHIQLEVIAKDLSDTKLDADPETIVQFDEINGDKWLKFESTRGESDTNMGGTDKCHKIKIKRQPSEEKPKKDDEARVASEILAPTYIISSEQHADVEKLYNEFLSLVARLTREVDKKLAYLLGLEQKRWNGFGGIDVDLKREFNFYFYNPAKEELETIKKLYEKFKSTAGVKEAYMREQIYRSEMRIYTHYWNVVLIESSVLVYNLAVKPLIIERDAYTSEYKQKKKFFENELSKRKISYEGYGENINRLYNEYRPIEIKIHHKYRKKYHGMIKDLFSQEKSVKRDISALIDRAATEGFPGTVIQDCKEYISDIEDDTNGKALAPYGFVGTLRIDEIIYNLPSSYPRIPLPEPIKYERSSPLIFRDYDDIIQKK